MALAGRQGENGSGNERRGCRDDVAPAKSVGPHALSPNAAAVAAVMRWQLQPMGCAEAAVAGGISLEAKWSNSGPRSPIKLIFCQFISSIAK